MGWSRPATALLLAAALANVISALTPTRALASANQISIIEDDPRLDADQAGFLARARLLGADSVRVSVHWNWISPAPNGRKMPRHFNAADPAAYPAANWRLWDAIVFDAQQDGIKVDFDLMGGAPRWALGLGRPAG